MLFLREFNNDIYFNRNYLVSGNINASELQNYTNVISTENKEVEWNIFIYVTDIDVAPVVHMAVN